MNKYEKLQSILNKCIEKGRKPRGQKMENIYVCEAGVWVDGAGDRDNDSIHVLFSVESGLMESVEWKWGSKENDRDNELKRCDNENIPSLLEWKYMIMGPMTAEKKIDYFLENITDE